MYLVHALELLESLRLNLSSHEISGFFQSNEFKKKSSNSPYSAVRTLLLLFLELLELFLNC